MAGTNVNVESALQIRKGPTQHDILCVLSEGNPFDCSWLWSYNRQIIPILGARARLHPQPIDLVRRECRKRRRLERISPSLNPAITMNATATHAKSTRLLFL